MKDNTYFDRKDCDLEQFKALVSQTLDPASVPLATQVSKNIPLYDMAQLGAVLASDRRALMSEWSHVLGQGCGVLVLKGAYSDVAPINAATNMFWSIIEDERANKSGEDHFATSGANDRIWNAQQKLCLADPETFVRYYANPAISAVCEAWLGPGYQMTAQVNVVHPGGAAQVAHRDYHLGFQTEDVAMQFPAHVHDLSAVMTLQGAVAHCDMPVESGPTKLLPFSQLFRPGYLAYRDPDFASVFEDMFVQVPLETGDALFFNPALFHAAGANTSTDIRRMANLLQVSSPLGRAMETLDRDAMTLAIYPVLAKLTADGTLDRAQIQAAIAACAEGYSFPTNLDTDPPVGGLAPETQAALTLRALDAGWSLDLLEAAIAEQTARRRP